MTAIIVDDEKKVAQLIKNLIPWSELGMELLGMAHNGQDACELIFSLMPDVVIIDMRMPKVDGLEVIRRTVEAGVKTRFIVVSGYRYFEYAHNALKYGVENYLLKPVNQDELVEALNKIKMSMAQEQQDERIRQTQQESARRSDAILRRDLMIRMADEALDIPALEEARGQFGLKLQGEIFQCFAVKVDWNTKEMDSADEQLLKELERIIEKEFCSLQCETLVSNKDSRIFGLLNYHTDAEKKVEAAAGGILIAAQDYAGSHGGHAITVVLSDVIEDFSDAPAQMVKTLQALDVRIEQGTDKLYRVPVGSQLSQTAGDFFLWNLRGLENALQNADEQALACVIDKMYERMEISREIAPNAYYDMARQIVARARAILQATHDISVEKMLDHLEFCIDNTFRLKDMKNLLTFYLNQAITLYVSTQNIKNQKPVRDAIAYIDRHYADKINLEDAAEVAGLNPTYFSGLFKRETGLNFSEYLIQVRIEAAKELLRNTNLTIAVVAEASGYRDTKHFTQLFTRTMGTTPAKYRKLYS